MNLPLTYVERAEIFRLATSSLVHWYGDRLAVGMTDAELEEALRTVLGIFGGSGRPGGPCVSYTGHGLRIWGGRRTINHVLEEPIVMGSATIAMAREIYAIPDPQEPQQRLL